MEGNKKIINYSPYNENVYVDYYELFSNEEKKKRTRRVLLYSLLSSMQDNENIIETSISSLLNDFNNYYNSDIKMTKHILRSDLKVFEENNYIKCIYKSKNRNELSKYIIL